ncbi:hypothetical protein [Streptomyces sp. NPDC000983]|uniref:hypothetical protein n=1 Tax=Streptomyces sp. NPDC000983 TaxID=3154373 RepID=UPI003332829B
MTTKSRLPAAVTAVLTAIVLLACASRATATTTATAAPSAGSGAAALGHVYVKGPVSEHLYRNPRPGCYEGTGAGSEIHNETDQIIGWSHLPCHLVQYNAALPSGAYEFGQVGSFTVYP